MTGLSTWIDFAMRNKKGLPILNFGISLASDRGLTETAPRYNQHNSGAWGEGSLERQRSRTDHDSGFMRSRFFFGRTDTC